MSSYLADRAARDIHRCFIAAILILVVIELFAGYGGWVAPHRLLSFNPNAYSPFFAFAIGSSYVCQAVLGSRNAGLIAASMVGLVLFVLHCVLLQPSNIGAAAWLGLLAYYLGIGSTMLLAFEALHTRSSDATLALQMGLLPALFVVLSWSYLEATPYLHVLAFDPLLLNFDGSLGGQASLWAASLCRKTAWLMTLCALTYTTLPVWLGALNALQYRDRSKSTLIVAFVIAGLIGSALYFVYPAAGPRYLLGADFPFRAPELAVAPAPVVHTFLNAMPSLHMAWALLLWINTRTFSRSLRLAYALFCLLTAFATLGLGEHYLIDLIVACPLALLAQKIAERRYFERDTLLHAALIAAWLIYLRYGFALLATSFSGVLHWLAIAATLWFCLSRKH